MEKIPNEAEALAPEAGVPAKADDVAPGVRRVNNVPLMIIGGVLAIFVILVGTMVTRRDDGEPIRHGSSQGALPESGHVLDKLLISGATAGVVEAADKPGYPAIPVAQLPNDELPPAPPRVEGASRSDTGPADEHAAERMKMLQTALHAKTSITKVDKPPQSPGGEPADADADAAQGGSAEPDPRVPVHANGDYGAFDRKGAAGEDRWVLGSRQESPRSLYELRAGAVIPAIMISGINSDLPGQIIAQVSQDVFDTATGKFRLIPQGARLIGRYNHQVVFGQSRLLVAWQRIVFPDGKALDIGAMDGVDASGYAGFSDKVDNHYLRIFGSAIFLSGITAGLTSSTTDPRNDPYGSSNAAVLSQALAQQIGTVAADMLRKNLDVAPTLKIRPGYRFHVMAVKDMTFDRPYIPFE
ncbi:conjugal transfer protein TrbI [Luteibacter aegosomatis]|uniref:TrbI/VirB10 family protein n=1 Tax=Luteibacter aegosomatis TaxID=2911537 RepID=UPI001FF7A692|nr:TrbI/VirB10 family protein [Luteibacter aegosomatis]UPG87954.1 conjugal transfer protein TrbI [Luteibacter aegosomatis]